MIDADDFYSMIDVIYEIGDGGRFGQRILRIDLFHACLKRLVELRVLRLLFLGPVAPSYQAILNLIMNSFPGLVT